MTTPPLTNPLLDPAHLAMLAQQAQQTAPPVIRPPSTSAGAPPAITAPKNELGDTIGRANELGAPLSPSVPPITSPTQLEQEKTEQARKVNTGSGISQIAGKIEGTGFGQAHPLAGKLLGGAAQGLATLGDVGLRAVAPSVDLALPGTSLHHLADLHGDQRQIAGDEANAEKEAQTKNLDLEPQLNLAKQSLALQKQNETESNHQAQVSQQLAAHGFKQDETGKIVPLEYGEMSESQQAVHDLKASQEELADASKAYKQAQTAGMPKAIEMAQQRIETAQRNAATAAGRLGLSQAEYNANYLGTDAKGEHPLPGAPATATGAPEGLKTAGITKPTSTTQSKGQQGGIIIEAGNALKQAIDQNKDKIGNLSSYWNKYVNGTPIADPAVSKLMAQLGSYAALQPSLHGFRGQQALAEFTKIIGGVPKNPEALKAAIDGIAGTAGIIQRAGKVPTVGEPAANDPRRPANVPDGYKFNASGPKGAGWYAPTAK